MPELADVEGFRRVFNDHARGAVRAVRVRDAQVVRGTSPRSLAKTIEGERFDRARRHGKWLIAPVRGSDSAVLLHFGMTGRLVWSGSDEQEHRHDRVVVAFDDGELRYRDMRKLEGMHLTRGEADRERVLGDLGVDATEVSRSELWELLAHRDRQVKAVLMDQSEVAGLGTLLVDEILWRARLHPRTRASTLSARDCGRLHARMGAVLRHAIDAGRVPPQRNWLTGHRDDDPGTCPRCGSSLAHGRVGSRATVWCPRCQPEPDGRRR
ncbi:MAG: Fpg/Nei family DNA glycosylase [Actinophytocola sp.]|nr:Fpg/Nei family DNA glycosylase [Actinophytocola sp.]